MANKKSIAYHTAKILKENGCRLVFSVQSEQVLAKVQKLFPEDQIYICDVEKHDDINSMADLLKRDGHRFDGLLHSIAFANLSEGIKPYHQTNFQDFVQATNISAFSLVVLTNALKDLFEQDASVVTVSISSTRATSYGYMGPIKAGLEASVAFLAKSFSEFSNVRFNAVCAGPLKTAASAGIPGYINNYLFAEQLILRKKALETSEVASTVCFLLSSRSSGINATGIVVDGGMSCNYFDQKIVDTVVDNL